VIEVLLLTVRTSPTITPLRTTIMPGAALASHAVPLPVSAALPLVMLIVPVRYQMLMVFLALC